MKQVGLDEQWVILGFIIRDAMGSQFAWYITGISNEAGAMGLPLPRLSKMRSKSFCPAILKDFLQPTVRSTTVSVVSEGDFLRNGFPMHAGWADAWWGYEAVRSVLNHQALERKGRGRAHPLRIPTSAAACGIFPPVFCPAE